MLKQHAQWWHMHIRSILIAEIIVVSLLAIGIGASFFPSYRNCTAEYERAPTSDNQQRSQQELPTFVICEGVAAESNTGSLTVAATLLLALITYWLYILSREQSATTRAQLRAYISIRSKLPRVIVGINECQLILKNSGMTPAHNLEDRGNTWVDAYPNPISSPSLELDKDSMLLSIGPSDECIFTTEVYVSDDDLKKIRQEEMAVWSVMEITYKDAFGYNWETKVTLCMTGNRAESADDRRMNIVSYVAT